MSRRNGNKDPAEADKRWADNMEKVINGRRRSSRPPAQERRTSGPRGPIAASRAAWSSPANQFALRQSLRCCRQDIMEQGQ